ncbi:MAG: UDP-glucose 6-dehydrogenase, partial [Thermoplasmata archaeon]
MNISIVGAGYVGLVTGACFAKLGNNVIILDIDKEKLEKIKRGISPIYEEGLDELLKDYRHRIEVTQDYDYAIQGSKVTFICVGTPSKDDGSIDLSYVKDAARSIGIALREKKEWHLVVVKSTVLPG